MNNKLIDGWNEQLVRLEDWIFGSGGDETPWSKKLLDMEAWLFRPRNYRAIFWSTLPPIAFTIVLSTLIAIPLVRNALGYAFTVLSTGLFSLIVWVVYFCFRGGHKHFWKNPDAGTGVVMQNKNQTPPAQLSVAEITAPIFIPKGMYVIFPGWNGIGPFDVPFGEPIKIITEDINRTIIVKDDKGQRFEVKFQIPVTPISNEYLPRYLLISKETAENMLISEVIAIIRGAFLESPDGNQIFATYKQQDSEIQEKVAKSFGGPNKIVEMENHCGRFTNKPSILEIVLLNEDAEFSQFDARITNAQEGYRKLVGDKQANLPPEVAKTVIISAGGGANINYTVFDVNGLKEGSSFMAGLPGGGGKNKQKGEGSNNKKNKKGGKGEEKNE